MVDSLPLPDGLRWTRPAGSTRPTSCSRGQLLAIIQERTARIQALEAHGRPGSPRAAASLQF